ncbi:hypothetical protein ACTXMB_01575 [Arthrobacter rhombi]|uniref:hypothetical protein n=1 Tax=Arthrobacter rhombi TaxID=71253 RepID=UPI003FD239DA
MEMTTGGEEVPACHRSEEDIWERLDLPPDEHELSCPHCQEQRRRLQPLLLATRRLRETPPEEAAEEDAALERIRHTAMDGIRAEIRRGRRLEVLVTPHGPLELSVYVLNEVIRRAADGVQGIKLGRHGTTGTTTDAGLPAVLCHLSVQMNADEQVPEVAERLRAATLAALADELGVVPAAVDITVEDITHD